MSDKPKINWNVFRNLSPQSLTIRNRLVWGSVAIVFLAVAIMGVFVYWRTWQANAELVNTLDTKTREEAINILNLTTDRNAETLSTYFETLQNGALSLRVFDQNLFASQSSYEKGEYWDAEKALSKNDKGSWDNSNSEIASVFIPAKTELSEEIITDLNTIRQMDLIAPFTLESNPDIIAVYFGGITGYTLYYPNIDLAAIVPEDFDVTGRPWYTAATIELNPDRNAVWSDPYLDAALNGIVITSSAPVYDETGRLRGVVAQDIQLAKITEVVNNIQIGETGYAFLIDNDKRLIAITEAGYNDLGLDPSVTPLGNTISEEDLQSIGTEFNDAILSMNSGEMGLSQITLKGSVRYMAYRPIEGVNFSLAIIVPEDEMLVEAFKVREQLQTSNNSVLLISIFVIASVVLLTLIITRNFSNTLTSPLKMLTETAKTLAEGNLSIRAHVTEKNEFNTLAETMNLMAFKLQESIDSLETRVSERTSELEERSLELAAANTQIQRRASQFEALAQVAQSITLIRDIQELLPQIANVISEKYGFYHVGVFLTDNENEYAILTATNSEGGKKMLERNHRLKVGEQGIVGSVTATGVPRIALDVGADAVFFNNPDLPETHSEMALPLRSGDKVIGALDVQSTESGAFTDEDVQTLSLLADQVSLAIENARLFENSNKTLSDLQTLMRQSTREAWARLPEQENLLGYRYNAAGASPLKEPLKLTGLAKDKEKANKSGAGSLVVPIELRGEVIGNLVIQSHTGSKWNEDQEDLIRAVAERVALSAENARLFDETSKRAERERLVTEITGKIRSHTDPNAMLETAINELKNALGTDRVKIVPQSTKGATNKDTKV
ncbi:MAG TPA: GAF domain-containing protein [Anaerolineales bacterium]|nr:GAF domain-containing protein [Anaerolineales bacterium]